MIFFLTYFKRIINFSLNAFFANEVAKVSNGRIDGTRKGDKYIINGQKTWSSRASFADWAFGLFRSDPNSNRHQGLSFLLFPLNAEGITIRPISQLDGEQGFAEIFFENAEVPVENLVGNEGDGWSITMATAGFERGLMLRSPARFQLTARKLVNLYLNKEKNASSGIREKVIQCCLDAEAYALNTYCCLLYSSDAADE